MTDRETEYLQRWFAMIAAQFDADADAVKAAALADDGFQTSRAEAMSILDQLAVERDSAAFKDALQAWATKPGTLGFNGFQGQMFVNQLVNAAPDGGELAYTLIEVLALPDDIDDAVRKITALVGFVQQVKVGAHPAPARAPFLCSYFWGLADNTAWPIAWPSAVNQLGSLCGEYSQGDHGADYRWYFERMTELGVPFERAEDVLAWLDKTQRIGLNPTVIERCRWARDELLFEDGSYADADVSATAKRNAQVLVSSVGYLGRAYHDEVAEALGRSLVLKLPSPLWKAERYRENAWVDWRVPSVGSPGPSMRFVVTADGAGIGLRIGWVRDGWYEEATAAIEPLLPDGFELVGGDQSNASLDLRGLVGERFALKTYPGESIYEVEDLGREIVAVTSALQPAMDKLMELAGDRVPLPEGDDPLAALVAEFIGSRGYPTAKDESHRADREVMARQLAPDEIALVDLTAFRSLINTDRYGGPGPMSVLNTTIRDADAAELEDIFVRISGFVWGEDEPVEHRIDRLLDADKVRGLGESVLLKLLAICHPERFIPVFPYLGDHGKLRMLRLLSIDPPPDSATRGERQVQANDLLRGRLDPYFPNDPWGMGQFLFWLAQRDSLPPVDDTDVLAGLAEELLVDESFLAEIIELMREKGQVVFYGPPGTGKTYLARKLAEALAPDPSRRMIVQFHPSTSYEDFFEGYRPDLGADGQLTYRLTPGPLALLAERAEQAPGVEHVMVIDEINRANLPRVLGELLYLLEYRQERIRTLYRPEEAFELPGDLHFIGTMNTADRSIALVDAALRRRFHFIPFFPHEGPMAGLLERWLEREKEPAWVGEMLAMVNDELMRDLGGPHLQIGPSHFMRKGLDETVVRRTWEYSVFPTIEDQLFGEAARIEQYRFDAVLSRYRRRATPDAVDDDLGGGDGDDGGG